jgi:hypothetical protein
MEFKINVDEALNKKFSRNLLLVKNTNNGGEHQQRRDIGSVVYFSGNNRMPKM